MRKMDKVRISRRRKRRLARAIGRGESLESRILLAADWQNPTDALDVDDTGVVDVSDAIYVLDYLFKSGSPIPLPFPEAGIDPTDDDLAPCE